MNMSEARPNVYSDLPDIETVNDIGKNEMLNKIVSILTREYVHYNAFDRSVIQNEEIVKVILGIDVPDRDRGKFYSASKMKLRLRTPVQELVEQMDSVPGTERNRSILRTIYALLLNNRGHDLNSLLVKNYPEYYHHIRESSFEFNTPHED